MFFLFEKKFISKDFEQLLISKCLFVIIITVNQINVKFYFLEEKTMLVSMKEMLADAKAKHYAIPGGKKLIYNHIEPPLTALADFEALGKTDARFATLDTLVKEANGLWCAKAEKYLLENF